MLIAFATVHQGSNVAAHAVVPGAAIWVELGGVGDGMAPGAQAGCHRGKGREVEFGQAGHWAAEVDAFFCGHASPMPGHARAVESSEGSATVERQTNGGGI